MRRFEFIEGGSRKFWEVDLKGAALTVCFGRMGTDGQSKTTAFPSADEAMSEMAKLIREKTKKGYQEIAAAGDAGAIVAKALRRPTRYSNLEHPTHFMNYAVVEFDPEEGGLKDLDRKVYAVRTDYDSGEGAFDERLDALLADPKVSQLKGKLVWRGWLGRIRKSH
jgi:predicted DNA-binding WGR domain protein